MRRLLLSLLVLLSLSLHAQLDSSQFKVLSWNVFLRPGIMSDNQLGRVDSIAAYLLNSEAEVLVLQEVFHRRSRKQLCSALESDYPYRTKVGKTSLFGISSGVMIFSKFEILDERHIYFKKATRADQLAKKGGVMAVISVNGKKVDVIGTHLQAGSGNRESSIRKRQVQRLSQMPTSLDRATIFAGDFNIHRKTDAYNAMLKQLDGQNAPTEGTHKFTANFPNQNLMNVEGTPKWIDFILVKRATRIKIHSSKIDQPKSLINGKRQRISDHNPIVSILSLDHSDGLW